MRPDAHDCHVVMTWGNRGKTMCVFEQVVCPKANIKLFWLSLDVEMNIKIITENVAPDIPDCGTNKGDCHAKISVDPKHLCQQLVREAIIQRDGLRCEL